VEKLRLALFGIIIGFVIELNAKLNIDVSNRHDASKYSQHILLALFNE
jgi:hypothetical protein